MRVPLLDLKRQYEPLRAEIDARVREVIESQHFILGPVVERFEADVRAYCGAGCAVGMSSGTDAQLAALMALGIGPGDAVITTPYTFFATAGCISRVGARPVFVDIDPDTFNLSPTALVDYLGRVVVNPGRRRLEPMRVATGERLRAVVPVHLFGQCADMTAILRIGWEWGLPVLEDASQALGARYPLVVGAEPQHSVSDPVTWAGGTVQATHAGSMGDLGWFSFFPSKNLGAFGDGGLTLAREAERFDGTLRALRMHGMESQYFHRFVGGNFRLDALQAAVLAVKLPHLDAWSAGRQANAARYRELFGRAGLLEKIKLPIEPYVGRGVAHHHIYNQFVVRVAAGQRDPLRAHLTARGIGSAIYYPLSLHEQECFRPLGYRTGDFPAAEAAARESLALPVFPELTADEQAAVVEAVADFFS